MRISCYSFLVFAFSWWLATIPNLDWPARFILDVSNWPIDGSANNMALNSRFLSAIGASLLAGFSVLLLLVVVPEIQRGNRSIIRGTVIAILTWYVVDSVGCLLLGVLSNVVLNTAYVAFLLIPLLLASRAIRQTETTQ